MAKRIKLQALRTVHFEGREVRPGAWFDASVADAVSLCNRGKARAVSAGTRQPKPAPPAVPTYQTHDLAADAPPQEPAAEDDGSPPARRRRSYRTRDFRADD